MEKEEQEKSLVKVSNGIFSRIRRLILAILGKKSVSEQIEKNNEENIEEENKVSSEFSVKIVENKFVIESEKNENERNIEEINEIREEKEELEQKLKNYYDNIKKSI